MEYWNTIMFILAFYSYLSYALIIYNFTSIETNNYLVEFNTNSSHFHIKPKLYETHN